MAHPLTPSEKVLLKPCPMCGMTDSTDNATQESGLHIQSFRSPAGGDACRVQCACGVSGPSSREDWQAAEKWNRRTALASGSGDHAELVEEDGGCDTCDGAGEVEVRIGFGTDYVPCPECVSRENRVEKKTLLAEIAALRAQHEADMDEMARAGQNLQSQRLAITEAERKLAEAVGLLREAASEIESEVEARYDGVKDHPSMTPKYERDMDTPQRINAFLRKEAERG